MRVSIWMRPLLLLCVCVCLTSSATIQEKGPAVTKVVVKEGEDANLPCSISTGEDITQGVFDWKKDDQKKKDGQEVFFHVKGKQQNDSQDEQLKGRVSHFPEELKHGNASIKIKNTKISDSGNYTCNFPHLPNEQKTHVQFVVEPIDRDRSGEIKGAAAEPRTKILGFAGDGVLLQCEVLGASPEPEVEWQDSAGNILPADEPQVTERGGSYDIILLTTVTKTDNFSCVVRQKEINHEISAWTFAPVPEKRCDDWAAWFFGGWGLGVLTLAAVLALIIAAWRIMIRRNKGSPPQRNGPSARYSQVPPQTEPHQNGNGKRNDAV